MEKAVEGLKEISQDPELIEYAIIKERTIKDARAREATILEQGPEQGLEKGREEGREETIRAMVREMLKNQKFHLDDICKITKLAKKEIEKLKKEMEDKD